MQGLNPYRLALPELRCRKDDFVGLGKRFGCHNLDSFLQKAQSLVDDEGVVFEEEEEEVEVLSAKDSLLKELRDLAKQASKKGDYAETYKIERRITVIEDQE